MPASAFEFSRNRPICSALASDTLVETEEGPLPLEWVVPGHRVIDRDGRAHPVLWASATQSGPVPGDAAPVLIPAGALGTGSPSRDVVVAAAHRVLVGHPAVRVAFGTGEVLVAAQELLGLCGIRGAEKRPGLTFIHIALAAPAVILGDGLDFAALGCTSTAPPCRGLEAAEARHLRDTICARTSGGLRRSA